MRTNEEIVKRIEARIDKDVFGFETGDYVGSLDFESAKPYLNAEFLAKPDAKEVWEKEREVSTEERLLKVMKEYMPFAFGKAHDERGLSANRSIMHFIAWT